MAIRKLTSISLADLRHAVGVALCFADRAPDPEREEFTNLALLLKKYVELATLYHELDDEQRLLFLNGAAVPRGKA